MSQQPPPGVPTGSQPTPPERGQPLWGGVTPPPGRAANPPQSNPQYPNPQYPNAQYPNPQYPGGQHPNPQYPSGRYPTPPQPPAQTGATWQAQQGGYPYGPPSTPVPPTSGQPGPWNVPPPWQHTQNPSQPTFPSAPGPTTSPADPLGRRAPAANDIANYTPPRQRWPWWLAGGAAAVVAGLVIANFAVPGGLIPVPTSPTPTVATSPATPINGGTAFESQTEDATGYWRVVQTEWGTDSVDVLIEISCQSGYMTYSFFAFENTASEGVDSEPSDRTPGIQVGSLGPGRSVKGWVRFALPRSTSTIVLATTSQAQISALQITP